MSDLHAMADRLEQLARFMNHPDEFEQGFRAGLIHAADHLRARAPRPDEEGNQ